MEALLREVLARQKDIAAAIDISNWLGVAGRIIEIAIGIMLAFVLVRLNELLRRQPR